MTGRLTLTIRYADEQTTTRSRTLPEATADTALVAQAVYGLYNSLGLQRAQALDKAALIDAVADRARWRYGTGVILPAALAPPPSQRPTRPAPDANAGPCAGRPRSKLSTSPSTAGSPPDAAEKSVRVPPFAALSRASAGDLR